MAEQSQANEKAGDPKRGRKRIWTFAGIALAPIVIATLLWTAGLWKSQSVDEQLAAIEAARAIPDDENAAIIYNQLLEDYDESSRSPDFMDDNLDYLTRSEPWLSKDYPELAEWLKDRQDTISTLLEASKKEKCRFPIITDVQQMSPRMKPIYAMYGGALLLIRAANNDMAEGRIDAGIEKCRCLIQMANHLYQQPAAVDSLFGVVVEGLALDGIKSLIIESDATEKHLKTIEAALPHTKDNWAEISSKIIEFERLYGRKNTGLLDRLKFAWQGIRIEDTVERFQEHYLRQLADRRSNRIFIALRRYRNKNGRWPQTLDSIKNLVPPEILVDPVNGDSFVYKLTDEGFKLYSKGKDGIDEDGGYKDDADDWPIWPPAGRKSKKTDPNSG